MWSDFSGKAYSRADFAKRVAALKWSSWKPIGITLHNTAAPTLAQWAESGPQHTARIRNLQSFYEGKGWHGGPHWFISRHWLTEFSNPLRRGTHSPSFNAKYLGIEMVGDYAREQFNSGDGALVRDNSVFAMACLCRKFGWDPAKVIKLHKEDPRTDHDCPGKLVNKADVIARVKAEMARLDGGEVEDASPPPPAEKQTSWTVFATEFGGSSDPQDSAYGGKVHGDLCEASLPAKLPAGRRNIRVTYRGMTSVVARVNDLGPWSKTDAYWDGTGVPKAVELRRKRQKAENGLVPVNDAGLDLTTGAMDELGIPGTPGKRSAIVTWEFTTEEPKDRPKIAKADLVDEPETDAPTEPDTPAPTVTAPPVGFWRKITGWLTAAGTALTGFLYDWRVALIIVGLVVVLAVVVWLLAGPKIKLLVNKWLDRAVADA